MIWYLLLRLIITVFYVVKSQLSNYINANIKHIYGINDNIFSKKVPK